MSLCGKNHQYRINAVAYSEAKGEREWFERKGDRFDHTRLSLVNEPELETPELFFGTVVYGGSGEEYAGGDTLFTYERIDQDKGRALLTGWLYRCVAGIELRLGNMPDSIRKVELLADSIHTTVNARTYADFLSPYDMKRDGSYKHYVIGVDSLMEGEDTWTDEVMGDSAHIVGANLLPVCTSLSLRVTTRSGREEYTSLRLKDKDEECNSDAPKLRSLPDDGGNGTGIIPGKPDNLIPMTRTSLLPSTLSGYASCATITTASRETTRVWSPWNTYCKFPSTRIGRAMSTCR